MKLFQIYISRRICRTFLTLCLLILSVSWMLQTLQRINFVSDSSQSMILLVKISGLIFPSILSQIIPFCFMIATTETLSLLYKNLELLIINATGISHIILIKPVLILATFLSVFLFILENTVEPKFHMAIKEIATKAQMNSLFSVPEENLFHYLDDNHYIEISKRPSSRTAKGFFMTNSHNPSEHTIY
ncbi:LptF/LptG family permease, partial [Candidatus Liberibacter sp.]|uniref:LptF/LptG family permease n=1 Tax=Candidatus Liberibacter sp. TaxID=34022 RepID=UPI0015F6CDC2